MMLGILENADIDIEPFTCTDDDLWPNDVIEYNVSGIHGSYRFKNVNLINS